MESDILVEHVTLEKFKLALLTSLSPELLRDPQIHFSALEDMLVLRIKGFVWGEQAKRREVSYPKDWWQAFKKRWAPKWFLARWPVENTTVVMDAKLIYPDINISLPDERHFLHINKTRIS